MITLSRADYADNNKHKKMIEGHINSGWSISVPKKNYSKYTITHEMGHVVENYIMGEKVNNEASAKIKNDIIEIAKDLTGKSEKELLAEMSRYGSRTLREFFAESFTSYYLGGKDIWAKAINEYLKKTK